MKNNRKSKIKSTIIAHIINNKKEYTIMIILFLIGILLGVFIINNTQDEQLKNVNDYINTFIEKMKNIHNIDSINLLKNDIMKNIICAIAIWFFGTTVIRNTNSFWNCDL